MLAYVGLTHHGLALWPEVILDQHFTQRSRQSRLLSTVLDNPELLGVGIDERTAVVLRQDAFSVVGEGTVTVYDARAPAVVGAFEMGARQSVWQAKLSLLHTGQSFMLKQHLQKQQATSQSGAGTGGSHREHLRSYRLGAIGAFAECVGAGVKTLGLSSPMPEADLVALLDDARAIISRNGAQCYVEPDFLVTDLFPSSLTDGMQVILIYRDKTALAEYKKLKAEKTRLIQAGQWKGIQKEALARNVAKLLSYTYEKTNELLMKNTGVNTN